MVIKIKTIEQEVRCCDFCGTEDSSQIWVVECEVCGKHICEHCNKTKDFGEYSYLTICPDCDKKDFTEYEKLAIEVENLNKEADNVRSKMDEIIKKIKGSG